MIHTPYPLDDELYQKNLAFWEEHDIDTANRLRRFSAIKGKLICPESSEGDTETPVDLLIGTKCYFDENAWSRAKKHYTEETFSHRYMIPYELKRILAEPEYDPVYEKTFLPAFQHFAKKHKLSTTDAPQRKDTAQFTLFGLGLGCLLHHLVMETDAVLIIVLEESIEMVHHSLYVIDYTEIFDRMNARDGKIVLNITEVDEHGLELLNDRLRHHKFSFVQNGQVMINDHNVASQELLTKLIKKLLLVMGTKGFFLDQLVMLRNLASNVYRHKVPLLSSSEVHTPKLPCFVIGNGPSLEQSIETLRQYRDQAIIISCGTALGSLLARGIRPDIHTELENIPEVPKILRTIDEQYGLEDIYFVHTSTLDPAEPNLFAQTTQFHRPGVNNFLHPSHFFARLLHSEPTVTNIGLALAGRFGFSDIYLFGVDMGTVDKNKFHASKNVYDDEKQLRKLGWNKSIGTPELLSPKFAANFGGLGHTYDIMLYSRPRLESAIAHININYRCTVYNCSDGLRIEGAVPKLPHTLKLDIDPRHRQDFMAYFARAKRDIDDLNEPVEHFETILSPQKISESFAHYQQLIDQHVEEVNADTVHPLYTLFTAFEEEFERPELTPETQSRYFHNRIISGSFYLWTQKYIGLDTILSGTRRSDAAEIFITALREAFREAERMLIELAAEFEDVREERQKRAATLNASTDTETPNRQ